MKKLRLGIIGVGNMGGGHAQNIWEGKCPDIALTAAADLNPARLRWARTLCGAELPCFDSAEALMTSGLADAVLIAVPHYDHAPLAIQAFAQGLHVMCEKPAGVYTKQVRQMNEAAAASGKVFGMMFNQRTDPVYRALRAQVQSGGLGALRRTNWVVTNWYRSQVYYDSGAWRATWAGEGGGVLLNQCPHNLDLWQWICGMPACVEAKLHFGKWHDIEVEDDVTAYVEYPNGATGCFITSTGDCPGTNRLEVTLDGGKLVAEDGRLTLWKLPQPEPDFRHLYHFSLDDNLVEKIEIDVGGENSQHVGVLNAFAGKILHGAPLVAHGAEGIHSLTLSNAMHLSAWTNRPVALPLDEELFCFELTKRVKSSRQKAHVDETFCVQGV
jgi:predicted dehydrogenase